MKKIDVVFEHVEAHRDDYGNNRADLLAKKAAGIYTGSLMTDDDFVSPKYQKNWQTMTIIF